MVRGATWSPDYDLRVDTLTDSVSCAYFGRVMQTTNEDWEGASHSPIKHPVVAPKYFELECSRMVDECFARMILCDGLKSIERWVTSPSHRTSRRYNPEMV